MSIILIYRGVCRFDCFPLSSISAIVLHPLEVHVLLRDCRTPISFSPSFTLCCLLSLIFHLRFLVPFISSFSTYLTFFTISPLCALSSIYYLSFSVPFIFCFSSMYIFDFFFHYFCSLCFSFFFSLSVSPLLSAVFSLRYITSTFHFPLFPILEACLELAFLPLLLSLRIPSARRHAKQDWNRCFAVSGLGMGHSPSGCSLAADVAVPARFYDRVWLAA